MSVIIAVCGTNFCLFASDTRMVTLKKDSLVFDNDNTQKIFKLNHNLLFGATGLFLASETLLSPLTSFSNLNEITISNAHDATLDYMNNHLSILSSRNYLIGGKDAEGHFSLRYLHYNKVTQNIDVEVFTPNPPYSFAIVCALPASLESEGQQYQSLVGKLVNQCTSIDELVKGLAKIIRDISNRDNSVGMQVTALCIT